MRVVYGLNKLCDAMGCAPDVVRSVARHGAPIVVTGHGNGTRYLADLDAIKDWFRVPRITRRQKGAR